MKNQFRLLRHATLLIRMNQLNILVDPMLSPKDALDPVPNAANNSRIPMVDLPVNEAELHNLLQDIDGVIITHTHRDHWDVAAQTILNKKITVFCQPSDIEKIKSQGFMNVITVDSQVSFKGLTIIRTGGHHGTGEIEKKMGEVSGFVIKDLNETVYIAGDTIWCPEVKLALLKYQPSLTILNSGAPKYLTSGPITMTAEDVIQVCRTLPCTKVVAVHMETINHCTLNRAGLQAALVTANLLGSVGIPADGDYFE